MGAQDFPHVGQERRSCSNTQDLHSLTLSRLWLSEPQGPTERKQQFIKVLVPLLFLVLFNPSELILNIYEIIPVNDSEAVRLIQDSHMFKNTP